MAQHCDMPVLLVAVAWIRDERRSVRGGVCDGFLGTLFTYNVKGCGGWVSVTEGISKHGLGARLVTDLEPI